MSERKEEKRRDVKGVEKIRRRREANFDVKVDVEEEE